MQVRRARAPTRKRIAFPLADGRAHYVAELVPLPADGTGALGSPVEVLTTSDSDSGSEVEFGGARAPGFD